ncbi:hypothetical protein GCM10010411_88270 [Actinomadura fulvescens]|uniref:Uncharacterized protein n=1 Tax=Actinomadura fulvescens TaxID=46160 RepID=A0ABP6DBR0_9ACTN
MLFGGLGPSRLAGGCRWGFGEDGAEEFAFEGDFEEVHAAEREAAASPKPDEEQDGAPAFIRLRSQGNYLIVFIFPCYLHT